jgi:catechol 2,3-dioxygenase-like lactoylglutathione lyase family enzyme
MSLTLTHISLLVEDVQKALIFYSDSLGLKVLSNHGGYAELEANEQMKLSLFDRKAMEEALPTVQASVVNGHRSVIEFRVDTLDDLCATLHTKGVSFVSEPTDHPDWGIRTAYVQDLDGNLISLYKSLE